MEDREHYCENPNEFPLSKFFQEGRGKGKSILIVGEAPAPNGWRKSGKAFYTIEGKFLPTGKNLNKLLEPYQLTTEECAFTELVKCFVGKDRKKLKECGDKCWPIFLNQIKNLNLQILILLGKETLNIFNRNTRMELTTGKISTCILNNQTYKILPIYHPSPIGPLNHKKNLEIFKLLHKELIKIL